jgi:hypothetical protein
MISPRARRALSASRSLALSEVSDNQKLSSRIWLFRPIPASPCFNEVLQQSDPDQRIVPSLFRGRSMYVAVIPGLLKMQGESAATWGLANNSSFVMIGMAVGREGPIRRIGRTALVAQMPKLSSGMLYRGLI